MVLLAKKRRYFEKEGDDNKITEIIAVKTLTRRNNSVGWYCWRKITDDKLLRIWKHEKTWCCLFMQKWRRCNPVWKNRGYPYELQAARVVSGKMHGFRQSYPGRRVPVRQGAGGGWRKTGFGKVVKTYLDKNVYEAALERIAYCFQEFDNVLVSFSGGKDSGVMLNLCYRCLLYTSPSPRDA